MEKWIEFGSLNPSVAASVAVLEIAGGQVSALGLKTGDKVRAKATGNAG